MPRSAIESHRWLWIMNNFASTYFPAPWNVLVEHNHPFIYSCREAIKFTQRQKVFGSCRNFMGWLGFDISLHSEWARVHCFSSGFFLYSSFFLGTRRASWYLSVQCMSQCFRPEWNYVTPQKLTGCWAHKIVLILNLSTVIIIMVHKLN